MPSTGGPLPWNRSQDCSMLAGPHTGRTATGAPGCDSVQTPRQGLEGHSHAQLRTPTTRRPRQGDVRGLPRPW